MLTRVQSADAAQIDHRLMLLPGEGSPDERVGLSYMLRGSMT